MNCKVSEADLLMFVHGQLSPGRKAAVRLHALRCQKCREQLARYEKLSLNLARSLHNPALGLLPLRIATRRVIASFGVLVVLLTTLGFIVASDVSAHTQQIQASSAPVIDTCQVAVVPTPAKKQKTTEKPTLMAKLKITASSK